jgi:hypothetical protein
MSLSQRGNYNGEVSQWVRSDPMKARLRVRFAPGGDHFGTPHQVMQRAMIIHWSSEIGHSGPAARTLK